MNLSSFTARAQQFLNFIKRLNMKRNFAEKTLIETLVIEIVIVVNRKRRANIRYVLHTFGKILFLVEREILFETDKLLDSKKTSY